MRKRGFIMNRNALKIIACLTMLIDHIGFLFFPDLIWLRYIGRLSMPLFAFFIAEGCRYTSNKLRYFSQIFLLGLACQSVYIAEQAIFGAVRSFYLNILLTFSLSILLAYAYLYWEKNTESKNSKRAHLSAFLFIGVLLLIVGVCEACKYVDARTPYELVIDYGLPGILLPLAALISRDRKKQFLYFSCALVLFSLALSEIHSFSWFALFDIPLLAFYNGQKGKTRFKYGFYIFYPAHLAILYLIQTIF
jgi:hypothetical protein